MTPSDDEDRALFEAARRGARGASERKEWPFTDMAVNDFMRVTGRAEYVRGMAAARQAGRRNGRRFVGKYHDEKGYGVIGRAA